MKQVSAKLASFQFRGFSINKTIFERKDTKSIKSLSLKFNPSGRFVKDTGEFELYLDIIIKDNNDILNIEVMSAGHFVLIGEHKEEMIKSYLFLNAPAILFPYIRSYIATLSILSGLNSPITLPTLNMTNIGKELEKNTVFI